MLDQEERWLTYAEAGQLFGISAEAARAMARRQKWPRRTPNEHNALARVQVPSDRAVVRPRPPTAQGTPAVHPGYDRPTEELQPAEHDRPDVLRSAVQALESAVGGLREQLKVANERADRAEQRADEERARADREREQAERQAIRIEAELTKAQVEAAELRRQLQASNPPALPVPRSAWRRFLAWRR